MYMDVCMSVYTYLRERKRERESVQSIKRERMSRGSHIYKAREGHMSKPYENLRIKICQQAIACPKVAIDW